MLHSLEGMENLDWERLLQFKCPAGSLHSSPAASAYALSETGDKELLEYLETAINNFDGGGIKIMTSTKFSASQPKPGSDEKNRFY